MPTWDGGYLVVAPKDAPAGTVVQLQYALPLSETVEEMPIGHRSFRRTWRRDEVVGCDPKVPIYASVVRFS